jgi:hypothetical protein
MMGAWLVHESACFPDTLWAGKGLLRAHGGLMGRGKKHHGLTVLCRDRAVLCQWHAKDATSTTTSDKPCSTPAVLHPAAWSSSNLPQQRLAFLTPLQGRIQVDIVSTPTTFLPCLSFRTWYTYALCCELVPVYYCFRCVYHSAKLWMLFWTSSWCVPHSLTHAILFLTIKEPKLRECDSVAGPSR